MNYQYFVCGTNAIRFEVMVSLKVYVAIIYGFDVLRVPGSDVSSGVHLQ